MQEARPPEESAQDAGNEPGGLLRSTTVVGAMTALSRLSGLARDIGFSRWFGASPLMDAFFVAFKIPNLLRRFFAEGAFSAAFVPVFSEYRATRSVEETRELVDRVAGTLGLALFGITATGVIAAPILITVFAPGFIGDDGRYEMARDMLRLTFPYLFFISLTALAGAILNTYRSFAVPAFTPVLLNLVLIAFAGWVAPRPGESGTRAGSRGFRCRRGPASVPTAVPDAVEITAPASMGLGLCGRAQDPEIDDAGDVRLLRGADQHSLSIP